MRKPPAEQHSFYHELKFRVKAFLLSGKRHLKNVFSPVKKFTDQGKLNELPVIAASESELWNPNDNDHNRILTAGKIENLRVASRKLNGIEVKGGEVFSFWKHIGRPAKRKGYVTGREIREGCIVPTLAGGLCQLSNALYDAALKSGFEIIERHKHTRIIKGSLAEIDRDATVKWNYIDLRFKSAHAFRIEVSITAGKLVVRFRSVIGENAGITVGPRKNAPSLIHDCYSCGNISCFKHRGETPVMHEKKITTFILDEKWPEYDACISSTATGHDHFIVPLKKNRFIRTDRYSWSAAKADKTKTLTLAAIQRALELRMAGKKKNLFALSLRHDKKLAEKAARLIPVESTHLVVSQNLLPYLYALGVMGGRTFDVLMYRLPLEHLHTRLDLAFTHHPQSTTLNDYRAPASLVGLERAALNRAEKIITPHTEIASLYPHKCNVLRWKQPETGRKSPGKKILFPASPIGRKGAYEMRKLAKELKLSLVVVGKKQEHDNFWDEVKVEPFNTLSTIGLVIYPAYVEQQPRLLLRVLAQGIPVIASSACGLPEQENLVIVQVGNYDQLKQAVRSHLEKVNNICITPEKVFQL